jgi:hypothetical protein
MGHVEIFLHTWFSSLFGLDKNDITSKSGFIRNLWVETQGRYSGWRSRQARIVGCGSALNFNPAIMPLDQIVGIMRSHKIRWNIFCSLTSLRLRKAQKLNFVSIPFSRADGSLAV